MSRELKVFEAERMSHDPLDDVKVGDWYWVKFDDMKWNKKRTRERKVGEHEEMMCVEEIGSNYVGFSKYEGHGSSGLRVHFDNFARRCRPEPDWKAKLEAQMREIQRQIAEKTKELIDKGKELYLLPSAAPAQQEPNGEKSFLPAKSTLDLGKYKTDLVAMRDSMPAVSKEIEELAKDYATTAKNMSLPEMARLGCVKEALGVVEDRIFTIELYAGLQETVVQIADGEPAGMEEKVAVRQQLLFMDEETLFDYESGGMDFGSVEKFDEWVARRANLDRILPERKGVVAFRVRRHDKDYGSPSSLLEAWTHMAWHDANKQTYLLIRNGERVYRILTALDFSPRLVPRRDEIGEEQFKKVDRSYNFEKHGYDEKVEMVTKDSVRYDDHVKEQDRLMRKYNRVVVLLQGLLDRSKVFHPHPVIRLAKAGDMDEWVRLIRDEEDGLPANKVDWVGYRDALNASLRVGKWVRVRFPDRSHFHTGRFEDGTKYHDPEKNVERRRPRRSFSSNEMPKVCKVESMRKDGSAVQVSWPEGQLSRGRKRWVDSPERPGWGRYEYDYDSGKMLHEWVPTHFCLNVSDYAAGDYKMFLCDRALTGKYLEWAPFLLAAEDWSRERAKGVPPEKDAAAQVRR